MTPEERARESVREQVVIAATPSITMPGIVLSWGGIWAGFLFGIGVLMLLNALGLAIGISIVDPNRATGDAAQAWGIGAGVWVFASLLIALFVGGMVSSRASAVVDPGTGALQGGVVWVLAMIGMMLLGVFGVSLGTSALLGAPRVGVPGPTMSRPSPDLSSEIATGDVDQVIARLADPATADRVASATGVPRDQVQATLTEMHGRVAANRSDPDRALTEARQGLQALQLRGQAAAAKPYATATSWATFGVMILSLGAAVLGGRTGTSGPAA